MPKRPKTNPVRKEYLQVKSTVFGPRSYKDRRGKIVKICYYEEARLYAAQNGYRGIKVEYT